MKNTEIDSIEDEKPIKIKKINLEKHKKNYKDKNLITFGVTIDQKYKEEEEKWKKELFLPKGWPQLKLDNNNIIEQNNGLGLITGKVNNIIVIDIDNIDDWNYLLNGVNEVEPDTVKAISGSGGIHLFFKYNNKLENITSKDRAICYRGRELQIDIKTNGGFIIVFPSSYYNKNLNKTVTYKWKKSILKHDPIELPEWLEVLLFEKQTKTTKTAKITKKINEGVESDSDKSYEENDFMDEDVKKICELFRIERIDNYKEWTEIGMCLKNLSDKYLKIWLNISKKSKKFNEEECNIKWKSFKKTKNGLKIGSLIKWALEDNESKCRELLKDKDIKLFVEKNKDKFPDNNLEISNIIKNNDYHYMSLRDTYCPIKSSNHGNNNMYLELTPYELVMKCNICVGCKYPCEHIRPSNKDIKKLFNINIDNLTINNYYGDNTNIIDAEIEYVDLFEDKILNKLIIKSLNGTHYDIAEVLFYLTKKTFRFDSRFIKQNDGEIGWYEFINHRWIESRSIRSMISEILPDYYEKIYEYHKRKYKNEIKLKKIRDIINSLKTTVTKNNIITELQEINESKLGTKFVDTLDCNPYLLGFNNGVYDLEKFEFRSGKPEDLIQMTCGYDFIITKSDKNKDILNFLTDIQPNEKDRDYLLTFLGSALEGVNYDELFHIFSGVKRNGKSTLGDLICETFGDYAEVIQPQLLTGKRPTTSTAQPEIIELDKKRIVIASEIEPSEKFNTAFIKGLTGNDKCKARNLYKGKIKKFTPVFKLVLSCNDKPNIDKPDDEAFWHRCRCLAFPNIFVENPKNGNEKKQDKQLKQKLKIWGPDFMFILIDYHKKYKLNGLKTTDNVLKFTKDYQNESNPYEDFANLYIRSDVNSAIGWTDLKVLFTCWYINNKNKNCPTPDEIKIYFEKKYFKEPISRPQLADGSRVRGWKGFMLLNMKDVE